MSTERTPPERGLTYRDAGVDIEAGNALVERIKSATAKTKRDGVLGGLGGFGAMFKIPSSYQKPILVAGTDGVGTKLKLAIDSGRHDGVGIDLVAMCVNDLLVCGAEPLFFLDYYATAALQLDVAEAVIGGIADGCAMAGAALIGGETAEMPGMYASGDYDLAGFCVGVVEEDQVIDGSAIAAGDVVLGISSSGPHSNGYSLVRKILQHNSVELQQTFAGATLADALLQPTKIYVKALQPLLLAGDIHGLAHITGGGITENLPRVLPDSCKAVIDLDGWDLPEIFGWLRQMGNVANEEMLRTFNCGIGMIAVVPAERASAALQALADTGETAFNIGVIKARTAAEPAVEFSGSLG
ncbi:MAG: phosphoribosylformylglycinamidine cyclo-ligase [Pseudomonadales bacterium]|nr:phosphoribosylformylglycinamidine cyclo-ligase [Pseudomonadales bacterium]NNM10399.1 phosphoribosylformylglycinamidine cyclo-ligase [Pseudomonadales bacterium]